MATVLRTAGAVVVAVCVAMVLLIAVEAFSAVVHPVPEGFGNTMEEMCLHVERFPSWVLAVAVPAWGFIAFASTWIAGRLGNFGAALCVGLLLVAAALWNIAMLPYAVWFKVAVVLVIPTAVAFAITRFRRRTRAEMNIEQPLAE